MKRKSGGMGGSVHRTGDKFDGYVRIRKCRLNAQTMTQSLPTYLNISWGYVLPLLRRHAPRGKSLTNKVVQTSLSIYTACHPFRETCPHSTPAFVKSAFGYILLFVLLCFLPLFFVCVSLDDVVFLACVVVLFWFVLVFYRSPVRPC